VAKQISPMPRIPAVPVLSALFCLWLFG